MAGRDYSGDGLLVVGDERFPVRYRLQTFLNRGWMDGAGVVSNAGGGTQAAFDASKAILEMDNGQKAPIIVTRWSPGAEFSEFQLAGAIE